MSASTVRLVAFTGGLVLALAAGWGIGRYAGPVGTAPADGTGMSGHTHSHGGGISTGDQVAGPVTNFAIVHDKPMHLVVVRRDLSGYRHLHPTMAQDGTWSVDLTAERARGRGSRSRSGPT